MRYHVPSGGAGSASVALAVSVGALLRRRFCGAGLAAVAAFGVCDAPCRELERVVRVVVGDLREAALSPACAGGLSDWVRSDWVRSDGVRSDGVRVVLLGIDVAVGGRVVVHADRVRFGDDVCDDGNLTRAPHTKPHSPAEPSNCPMSVRRHPRPNHVQPKCPNENRAQSESKYDQLSKYKRIIHDGYAVLFNCRYTATVWSAIRRMV